MKAKKVTFEEPSKVPPTSLIDPTNTFNYYYCPKCKSEPKIYFEEDKMVRIKCRCSTIKSSIADDLSKNITIEKLAAYEVYFINLKRYYDEVVKFLSKPTPPCSVHKTKSAYFCTFCKVWFCEECSSKHQKHLTYKSHGLELNSTCEDSHCKSKGKIIEFFCDTCKVHLCADCKYNYHGMFHTKYKIDEVLPKEKEKQIYEEIQNYNQQWNKEKSAHERELNTFKENILSQSKKVGDTDFTEAIGVQVDKRIEHCKFIMNMNFPSSLWNAYITTKNIPNFNTRNNLILLQKSIPDIWVFMKKLTQIVMDEKIRRCTFDELKERVPVIKFRNELKSKEKKDTTKSKNVMIRIPSINLDKRDQPIDENTCKICKKENMLMMEFFCECKLRVCKKCYYEHLAQNLNCPFCNKSVRKPENLTKNSSIFLSAIQDAPLKCGMCGRPNKVLRHLPCCCDFLICLKCYEEFRKIPRKCPECGEDLFKKFMIKIVKLPPYESLKRSHEPCCGICLIDGLELKKFNCGCAFEVCDECYDLILSSINSCPYCRQPIS